MREQKVKQGFGKILIKQLFARGSKFCGTVTVTSGTDIATVSLTNVNSDSLIYLQGVTDVGSDKVVNFFPTSRVEGSSFGVSASATTARDVTVNYMLIEV